MRRSLLKVFCLCSMGLLWAQDEYKSPQDIQRELDEAEAQFERAKKMFNPWYTGPLLTPSASMMSPGFGNIQPYVFVTDNYASFDEDRHSHSLVSDRVNLNPSVSLQFGVTNTMDICLVTQANGNWQSSTSGGGFGDTGVTIGFPVCLQTRYIPQIKVCIKETFPTGRYQHLNSNGLNLSSTGGGIYQTQFSLVLSKLLFWSYLHPMNIRLALNYNVAPPVRVHGFNAYGGGYGTNAKVHVGNVFNADLGIECSLTQRWVLAADLAYTAQDQTTYSGTAGTSSSGAPASLGGGYSDNLSLAPAIEYNWNENLGVLGGVWFSVYGRNTSNFVSGIVSVTWTFKVS